MSSVSATIRQNAIVAAIKEVAPADYTRGGAPEVKALTAILGFEISAEERDAAWQAAQEQEKAEAAGEAQGKNTAKPSPAVTIDKILPGLRNKGFKI